MPTAELSTKLTRMLGSRRATERRLSAFLLGESERAASTTIEELAEVSGVSVASVSRMIRVLGLSGFAELRHQLAEGGELPDNLVPVPDAVAALNSVSSLVKSSVESCRTTMTAELLDRAAGLIASGTEVFVVGSGTSAVTASYIYTKLFRLGIACSVASDAIIVKMKSALMRRGGVLIAVSSSGRTKTIVEAARLAKDGGAKVIVLTDYKNSPLTRYADLLLSTTNRQSPDDPDAELPLIQGQLTIVDMVYALLSTRMGNEGVEKTRTLVLADKHL